MQNNRDRRNWDREIADISFRKASQLLAFSALNDEDPLTRKHAIYMLGYARNPDCIETFVQALRDPEKAVRSQATRALAVIGEKVLDRLVALAPDPDWKVRYRAAEALGMLKDKRAIAPLLGLLNDEKDHVQYMAIKSLGMIEAEGIKESLQPFLTHTNPYARTMAASVIEKLNNESSRAAFTR